MYLWFRYPVSSSNGRNEVDKKFTEMGKALEKSAPNPMYKGFDVYYNNLSDLLTNYLLGKIDLDTMISKHGELIKSIDKTIVQ